MKVASPLVIVMLVMSSLLVACADDDDMFAGRRVRGNTPNSDPNATPPGKGNDPGTNPQTPQDPSGNVDQTPGTQNPGTQNPGGKDPDVSLSPLVLNHSQVALTVPPNAGTPLFPVSLPVQATLDQASVTPMWESSDTRIASVNAAGLIEAVGAGSATVTASYLGRQASVPVTVDQKSRLKVAVSGVPDGVSLSLRISDAQGSPLATAGGVEGTFDLSGSVNLSVEAHRNGTLIGLGRWDGLTLRPNQLVTRSIPVNVPVLTSDVPNGGPGRELVFFGSGFSDWKRGQGGSEIAWSPERQVTIADQAAAITFVRDSQLNVRMPSVSGEPALRKVLVSVGGISLEGDVRLLGSLTLTAPTAPMTIGADRLFTVEARDSANQVVSAPSVTWVLEPGGLGSQPIGDMLPSGLFKPKLAGTGTIAVSSGTLKATASITVGP